MFSFFRFSKGDFVAAALTSALLISTLILKNNYPRWQTPPPLSNRYEQQIQRFLERQRHLEDSVQAAYSSQRDRRYSRRQDSDSPRYRNAGILPDDSVWRKPKTPGYAIVKVELNRCDTADIVRIPLFGSKRAAKIVEYRNRLGGFHALSQLHEIFIIQNITLEHMEKYFTVDSTLLRKIPINAADYATLVNHPYFDSYLAKTILQYRQKNGKIQDMEHLLEITHLYEELAAKLQPYLEF